MRVGADGWLKADPGGAAVIHLPTVRTSPLASSGLLGLVWHATAGVGGPRFAEGLARRIQTYRRGVDRAASWHVLIAKAGPVYQSAPFTVGTWHVGRPGVVAGARHPSVNAVTIGVELENAGPLVEVEGAFYAWPYWLDSARSKADPHCQVAVERVARVNGRPYDAFTTPQVASAHELVEAIARQRGWSPEAFHHCHSDFAAPAKTDPGDLWKATLPRILEAAFKTTPSATREDRNEAVVAPAPPPAAGGPSDGAILQLERAVADVMEEIRRGVVDVLKASSQDGRLSASVWSMIVRTALGRVKQRLGPDGMAELAHALGVAVEALDDAIGPRIEAAVGRPEKQAGGAGATARTIVAGQR